jgi:hypothetical protein
MQILKGVQKNWSPLSLNLDYSTNNSSKKIHVFYFYKVLNMDWYGLKYPKLNQD